MNQMKKVQTIYIIGNPDRREVIMTLLFKEVSDIESSGFLNQTQGEQNERD